jgi:hypothetical protein
VEFERCSIVCDVAVIGRIHTVFHARSVVELFLTFMHRKQPGKHVHSLDLFTYLLAVYIVDLVHRNVLMCFEVRVLMWLSIYVLLWLTTKVHLHHAERNSSDCGIPANV